MGRLVKKDREKRPRPPRCACSECGRFVGCGDNWGPCYHCEAKGKSPNAIFCDECVDSGRE